MSTKDLKEKGTHFLLLTGSTLLMAVGTYFFKFTNFHRYLVFYWLLIFFQNGMLFFKIESFY